MAKVNSLFFRATGKFLAFAILLSTCAPAVEAASIKVRKAASAAYIQASWNAYPEAAEETPIGGYDIGGPTSPDAAPWHADAVVARDDAVAKLNDPTWVRPEVEPVTGDSATPVDPGDNSIWSTDPTPTSAGNHMVVPSGGSGLPAPGSSGGVADGSAAALGGALAWQDSFPAGGTLLSTARVNSLNGNRLATVPIVSWNAKGGMPIDLTLYHNSGGSAGTMWGRGWRSSFDIEVVQGNPVTNPRRATVVFGDGSTIPFVATSVEVGVGQADKGTKLYSPPVGYYDALTRFGNSDHPGGWYLRRRDGSRLEFNTYGRLTSIRDARQNVVTIGRQSANSPMTSVTDSAGRQLVFTISSVPYSIYQGYSKVTDPSGREWKFQIEAPFNSGGTQYNVVGDLLSVTLPKVGGPNAVEAPTKIEWSYNPFGAPQMWSEKDPMGKTWFYTYEFGTGRLTKVKDPLLKEITYATGTTAVMTTPRGAKWTHTYQGETIAAVKDAANYTVSYHYDARRNRDEIKDRRGKVWRSTYDPYGNMTVSRSPEQYKIPNTNDTFIYDGNNVLTSAKNARNGTTTITPEVNDPKIIVDADGATVLNSTYDTAGQPEAVLSSGVSNSAQFDNYGRPTSVTTADGQTTIQYVGTPMGIMGLPFSVTVPGRGTREMVYDWRGRVTRFSRYAPDETGLKLDALGRAYEIQTQDGTTYVQYDELSRLKKVTNPRGDVEEYKYDDDGNLTDIFRGNGASVHYSVEARGDVSAEYDLNAPFPTGSGYVTLFSFDGEGNVTATSAGAGTIVNTYDDDGNLKTVTHPDQFVESYTYDEDGNRKQMIDRSGTTNWTYTLAGRPLTMSSPAGNVSYGYDAYGNQRTVAHAAPGVTPGIQTTITTNRVFPSGRATWYGNGYTNVLANYTYNPNGTLNKVTRPGGTSTDYSYDGWGRPTSIVHKNVNGGTIRSEAYTYEGTRVKTRAVGSVVTTYTYDVAGQIQNESRPGYSGSYTYDHNGNRLTRTVNGTTDTYSYTGDRLNSITRTGGYTKQYTYDSAGRPSQIKGWDNVYRTLAWSDEDKLTSAPSIIPGTQVYNGDGARVSRNGVPYRRTGSSVTNPVVDDGPNRALVPGLGERNGASNYILLSDRLGTNAIAIEPTGINVPPAVETDAFGLQWQTPGARSRFNWKGGWGYYDEDGGAYLIGHRWYDADAGRFLTKDRARQGRNWWNYCGNDPVNMIDPEGLDRREITPAERRKLSEAMGLYAQEAGIAFISLPVVIDTDLGGAKWEFNTLYISPTLVLDIYNWRSEKGHARSRLQEADFAAKIWLASIVAHEVHHILFKETNWLWRWESRPAENRGWKVQIAFLQKLRKKYLKDPSRLRAIDDAITRARESLALEG